MLAAAVLAMVSPSMCGQAITHDEEKQYQWQSMENGAWGFSPGWYYYFLHQKYSGAYLKWHWSGFKSGYRVHFDENRSNVKRIMPQRIIQEETQRLRDGNVEKERQKYEQMYKAEQELQIDRTIDLAYADYSEDFDHMQYQISECLQHCLTQSGGKLRDAVLRLRRENEMICEAVAYLHKTGPGYELENAKRQKGYELQKMQMRGLLRKAVKLVRIADTFYKPIPKD